MTDHPVRYRVTITETARRERQRLTPQIRERVDRAMQGLTEEPRPRGVRKLAGSQNDYRIKVGDYRILFEIADDERVITIWRVAHRREVYR